MLAHPEFNLIDDGIDLTNLDLYSSCLAPFGIALRLPRSAYVSDVFQELENEKIWTRDWVCIGAGAEIPHPSDLLPYTIGQHAIHVQRLPSGELIGRFNKAQHGGCRSIPAQCRTGKKTKCSYTSCGHSRDRGVIAGEALGEMSPLMGQYLGAVPERLLAVNTETVGPFVLANVDPTIDASHPLPVLSWDDRLSLRTSHWQEHRANWKIAGAAIVDGVRLHSKGDSASNRIEAEWHFPNLIIIRDPHAVLAVVLQPTAVDQALWRVSCFGDCDRPGFDAASANLMHILADAAADAQATQMEIEASPFSDVTERSDASWQFNQLLVERIVRQHVVYWNAPLMGARAGY